MFKKHSNIFPYFDIPIQHSSDRLLKLMNRTGNQQIYKDVINKIRDNIPNAVFRTTLILGFPSETKKDFENVKAFVKEMQFDHLGAFTYSREEDTKAYDMPSQVSAKVAQKRKDEMMQIQQEISYQKNLGRINQTHLVLIEDYDGNNYYGRSYLYAPDDIDGHVIVKSSKKLFIGDYVPVKITKAHAYDIEGEAQI